ncbi:MAG TPA: acetoacetate decarboxylase [Cyanobacteria bacterium UBA12227]|nr:acetoacetate decarboxylase [Cyanobacteria bacterium UBA12227]HAX89416.1 acetoacetate decarboxylase [Cyanobacteria bacterium UBA11370]HBY76492.1 acetoacetate decarboxylase [Cyanobacteria bacterium UBA11148]
MAYPKTPWFLQGYGFQTLHLLDIKKVRQFIPSDLDIIPILPGKTLGGIYVAFYGLGSTLMYNELIIISALTRYGSKVGAWISHIYVDNADSMAGGREVWGLPKELAQFTWNLGTNPGVCVHQENQLLCSISSDWQLPQWRLPLTIPAFSTLDSKLLSFEGQGEISLCLSGANLQVPVTSPFSMLGIGQPWLSFYYNQLHLLVSEPKVIRESAIAFT